MSFYVAGLPPCRAGSTVAWRWEGPSFEPAVFLFDEPLSHLDAQLRLALRSELKDLHRRLGTTTLCVTHDQGEAMALAQTICVLREGQVQQIGTPEEIYDPEAHIDRLEDLYARVTR